MEPVTELPLSIEKVVADLLYANFSRRLADELNNVEELMDKYLDSSIFTGWYWRIKLNKALDELSHHIDTYKEFTNEFVSGLDRVGKGNSDIEGMSNKLNEIISKL